MGAPAKFLFDLDFAASGPGDGINSGNFSARLSEAEQRGFRNGFSAAQIEAAADTQRRLAGALERISQGLESTVAGLGRIEMKMETEVLDVAMAAARQLCGQLIARHPLDEILALVADCFRHLVATPHLVVRINDTLYEQARGRIEDLVLKYGFEGRLVILAEPDIESGDCRIEWADGGVTRERATTDAKIAELVSRYLMSRSPSSDETLRGTS